MFQGDSYQAGGIAHVPRTLREAADLFQGSGFARQAFGEAVHRHYSHFYHSECELFERAVTDWERKRYFERI